MTYRWHPVGDLVTLQERMNRLFEEAARRRDPRGGEEDAEGAMERADWHPAADVFETGEEFVIVLDLPGIERSGLNVNLDDNRLVVSGERAAGEAGAGAHQRRSERPTGRFARSFTLPSVVARESISADYKDGVLRVHLPKRAEPEARRVQIKIS